MAQTYPLGGLSTHAGLTAFVITIISVILVTVVLILRVSAKRVSRRPFRAHDYIYFIGYTFAVCYSAQFLSGIHPGVIGLPMDDALRLYPDETQSVFKIIAASTFIWAFATTLVKLSLLSYYLTIFTTREFQVMAYIVAILSIMLAVAGILIGSLMCRPFAYSWDRTIAGGHCGDSLKMQLSTCVVNIILDFTIVLLPLPLLWTLRVSLKKKALLSGIFSLGLCICAINITRTIIVVHQNVADTTHGIALIGLFSILEVNVGYICAGLPTLGPLIFRAQRGKKDMVPKINTFVRLRQAALKNNDGSVQMLSTMDEDGLPLQDIVVEERGLQCSVRK